MITCSFIVCAEGVIRDADTNNISIYNILEDITAESYPLMIPRIALLAVLNKEDEDAEQPDLNFYTINNETVIANHKLRVDFREKNRSRAIIRLNGVPFQEPGKATFKITDAEEENVIGEYNINLKIREGVEVTSD